MPAVPEPPATLLVSKGADQCLIQIGRIECVSAAGNYVEIVERGQRYLMRATLKQVEDLLPAHGFHPNPSLPSGASGRDRTHQEPTLGQRHRATTRRPAPAHEQEAQTSAATVPPVGITQPERGPQSPYGSERTCPSRTAIEAPVPVCFRDRTFVPTAWPFVPGRSPFVTSRRVAVTFRSPTSPVLRFNGLQPRRATAVMRAPAIAPHLDRRTFLKASAVRRRRAADYDPPASPFVVGCANGGGFLFLVRVSDLASG